MCILVYYSMSLNYFVYLAVYIMYSYSTTANHFKAQTHSLYEGDL